MSCVEYQQKISMLVDGEVPHEASTPLFAHLASCETCRSFFHQMQELKKSLDRLSEPAVRPHRAPLSSPWGRPQLSLWQRRVSLRYPVAVLAAAVLCAVLLFSVERSVRTEPVCVATLPTVVVAGNTK